MSRLRHRFSVWRRRCVLHDPQSRVAVAQERHHQAQSSTDLRIRKTYYKALGPKVKENWLAQLDGPSPPIKKIRVGGTEYVFASACKNHDCGDNNTVLLYSAAQGVVYGKIVQQRRATLTGAPPPAVASELDRLWVAEWRQITASYALTVTINDFSVVRNGSGFFTDDFADGNEPPSGPANPNLLSGNAYVVSGTIPDGAESGGVLLLDSANGILGFNAVGDPRFQVATFLRTDTSANLSVGLKSDDTLALTGIFSLTTPPGPLFSAYGIRFTDSLGGTVHQFAQLFVEFNETRNQAQIHYVLQDFDPDIITQLGSILFNPPAGADEIRLHIENTDANKDNFFGSFSYLQGGSVLGGGTFLLPAVLFDDENFVRAQFFVSQDVAAVPEPSSIWLLIAGLGGLAVKIRGRRS